MRDKSYIYERIYEEKLEGENIFDCEKVKFWNRIMGKEFLSQIMEYEVGIKKYFQSVPFQNRDIPQNQECNAYHISIDFFDIDNYLEGKREHNFIQFYVPFLKMALFSFKNKVSEITSCRFEIWGSYLDIVLRRLEKICIRTLIKEIANCKSEGKLKGKTTREEYEYFSNVFLSERAYSNNILRKYPILERSIFEVLNATEKFVFEALKRLEKNKIAIQSILCEGQEYHCILQIQGEISDSHNGGKGALIVRLDNGFKVVYKPHSIENEKFFYDTIQKLASACGENVHFLRMIVEEEYGFEEFIAPEECKSLREVQQYYTRLGMELCLIHLLGTSDIHNENLIADGAHPMIIDLENLITVGKQNDDQGIKHYIDEYIRTSVLCSGILPYSRYGGNILDDGEEELEFKIPIVTNGLTSDIQIAYRNAKNPKTNCWATYKGKRTEVTEYLNEMKDGFSKLYTWCMQHKGEIWQLLKPLQKMKSRYLLADTQMYAMILNSSYHPMLLGDGANRQIYLNTLWLGRNFEDEKVERYVKEEVFSMLRHDIPYFYMIHDRKTLLNNNGMRIENFFEQFPIDEVKQRLEKMDERELEIQKRFIDMSIELCAKEQDSVIDFDKKMITENQDREEKKIKIVEAAEKIGDMGIRDSICEAENGEIGWYTLQVSNRGRYWWKLMPANMYLYDGFAGILLFYTILATYSSKSRYKEICDGLERQMFDYTEKENSRKEKYIEHHNTGLLNGEASIIYVYLMIYKLKKNNIYLEYVRKHSEVLLKYLKKEEKIDLTDGLAGAIVTLCKIYEMTKEDRYLQEAVLYGEKLLDQSIKSENGICWKISGEERPLLGIAHGNAGFVLAFKDLYDITREEKYLKIIVDIVKYEDFYYDEEIEDWMDLRGNQENIKYGTHTPAAWCHGSGGILFSRMVVLKSIKEFASGNIVQEDIRRAVNKLRKDGHRQAMCLCHGTCGNYMALREYYLRYREKDIGEEIDNFVEKLVEEILNDTLNLIPKEKYHIGLMNGYLGIGYFLLNMYSEIQNDN